MLGDQLGIVLIYVISVLFLLCFCARLFIDALWSPSEKRMTSWLSFAMSKCEVFTFLLVSCVWCGACLYRFPIFDLFLTVSVCVFCRCSNSLPHNVIG